MPDHQGGCLDWFVIYCPTNGAITYNQIHSCLEEFTQKAPNFLETVA